MNETRRSFATIAAFSLLLLALSALRPLALPDEGRYAEMGRWMLVSGDWFTPRLNGIPFFHKPPLQYWLEAVSMSVFGVHAWSARLVVALHAVLMLCCTYYLAGRVASEKIARNAVCMLGSSLAFLMGGQYVNHDMMVATWIAIALTAFGLAFAHADKPHVNLARIGFAACALGVLAKGLIGLALPGLVLLVWLVLTRQMRKVLYLPWISGLLIFCAIALPWFIASQMQFGEMLQYMFGKHHFGRYTGKTFNNARPFWFYGVALGILFFPWLFFAFLEGFKALKHMKYAQVATKIIAISRANPLSALLWLWPLVIVGFFSIPNSKLIGYVLPVMPALAVLAALGWQRSLAQHAWTNAGFAAVCAVSMAIGVGANLIAANYTQKRSTQDIAQQFACAAQASDTVYAVGEYPYDFPFYAQTSRPMVVVQDWPTLRQTAGDNWRRELFEGAHFDAQAAKVLQTPEVLPVAAGQSGNWLIAPKSIAIGALFTAQWRLFYTGNAWNLYQSRVDAPVASDLASASAKSPVATQKPGLPGCKN